jgi:hypothetical protein
MKKLPKPFKNRTGVNNMGWLKSLHDAIKCTPSSFFFKIQRVKKHLDYNNFADKKH